MWTNFADNTWYTMLKPKEEAADKDSPRPEPPPDWGEDESARSGVKTPAAASSPETPKPSSAWFWPDANLASAISSESGPAPGLTNPQAPSPRIVLTENLGVPPRFTQSMGNPKVPAQRNVEEARPDEEERRRDIAINLGGS